MCLYINEYSITNFNFNKLTVLEFFSIVNYSICYIRLKKFIFIIKIVIKVVLQCTYNFPNNISIILNRIKVIDKNNHDGTFCT